MTTSQIEHLAPLNVKTVPIIVLLVDDEAIVGESIKKLLEEDRDIQFHFCMDPSKAVSMANEIHPTVILQDLVMPDIDGLMLIKYFRANPSTTDVPIILLSMKEDLGTKAEAFVSGATDYIVKLPNKIELVARIRHHSSSYTRLLQRNDAYDKLAESQRMLQEDLAEAAKYVKSLLPAHLTGKIHTITEYIPSTILGGDAFGYHWLDNDHFAFYLFDVCGHGVGAALLSISIMNVLRSQTLLNTNYYEPASVFAALNENFLMENHNDKFFTMWYGIFCCSTREILYSNGGHPPPLLITGPTAKEAQAYELKSGGIFLGVVSGMTFEQNKITVDQYNRLYLFSDGAYELKKPSGELVSYQKFITFLKTLPDDDRDIEKILQFGKRAMGHSNFADDFSLMKLVFN